MKEIAKELQVIKLNGKLKKGRANSNNGLKKTTTRTTYPYAPWTSADAIIERPMAQNLGDSLTLGLLAIDGMNRGPNNNTGFGLIPVRPISYSDAMHLLRLLKGKNFICKTQDMFRQLFFNDYLA